MQVAIQQLIDHLKRDSDFSVLALEAYEVIPPTNYYRTMYNDEPHEQVKWYRLAPGSAELESLDINNDESFPGTLDVSFTFLTNEAARRAGKTFTTCAFCSGVAYDYCDECDRAICVMHYRSYDDRNRPLCPAHFDEALDERKRQESLQQHLERMQKSEKRTQ
jgi:hypothetical protein